jgi:hypothetical protein
MELFRTTAGICVKFCSIGLFKTNNTNSQFLWGIALLKAKSTVVKQRSAGRHQLPGMRRSGSRRRTGGDARRARRNASKCAGAGVL